MNIDQLIESLRDLPEPAIEQVQEYVEFLIFKHQPDPEIEFWRLVSLINQGDNELNSLVEELSQVPEAMIFAFQDTLALKLRALDGPAHFEAFGKGPQGASSDSFLYGRCYVVSRGKDFYEMVLRDPEKMPAGKTFEKFLYCAEDAYLLKTGKDWDYHDYESYDTGHNAETWGDRAISYA